MQTNGRARILLLDIETSPCLAYVWAMFDQNVALNQIHSDWHVLSFAAKWLDDKAVVYRDQRSAKNVEDDKATLSVVWKLLDAADVVVTQNGKRFDIKKLNARFILNGFEPPSSFRQIDTLEIAKRHFAFTSNKLEYLSKNLTTTPKSEHKEFPGFELWRACLKGNRRAWDEMKRYNIQDILALEALYKRLYPWDNRIDFNVFDETSLSNKCACGSTEFKLNGKSFSNTGVFQRYRCTKCGAEFKSKRNLLSSGKRKSLKEMG